MKETGDAYTVHAEIPGVPKEDIHVAVDGNVVTLRAEIKPVSYTHLDVYKRQIWARAKKDITQEQYNEFYKQISHDFEAPLAHTHNRVEGSTEYTQLLYIPGKAPMDLYNREKSAGVKLYVKRVFIMDDAEALLPTYLRFVKGCLLYTSRCV